MWCSACRAHQSFAPPVSARTSAQAGQMGSISASLYFGSCDFSRTTLTAQPAQYAALPTVGTATAECAAWARKFWGRTAMGPEIEACANVIGQLSSKETQLRRRWAHGCASVLTSSDFLTF